MLLVKLDRQHPALPFLVGATIISQLAIAAYARASIPENQRVPFALYCGEFQRFATPTFAKLLTEVKRFKIATTIAHQARGQLDEQNKITRLNAGNLVILPVSGQDAEELAYELNVRPAAP